MKVLQVKQYHSEVADVKYANAVEEYANAVEDGRKRGGYPVESMFCFMTEDSQGYPIQKRSKGWVAYSGNRSVWGKNKKEAIDKFNS